MSFLFETLDKVFSFYYSLDTFMEKICRRLFTFIFLALTSTPLAFAVAPSTPNLAAVQNYSGPIMVFWSQGAVTNSDTEFDIFYSTSPLSGLTTSQMQADSTIGRVTSMADTGPNYYTYFTNTINQKTYYVRMAARNSATDEWSAPTGVMTATSRTETLSVSNITSTVDSIAGSTIDYDSSTITYIISLAGRMGSPFLPPASVKVDIKTNVNPRSVFVDPSQVSVTVVVSSSNFSASAAFNWNGRVYTDAGHKHNGGYTLTATPIDSNNSEVTAGKLSYGCSVDVVHINSGKGLVYQVQGANQPHYGPPFLFDYYMSKNAFVTWKIWNRNQTPGTADDTLVKVVVSTVPRVTGDSSSAPDDWDKLVSVEVWDGRNDNGFIVPNDIYRYTVDAVEYNSATPNNDNTVTLSGTIAYDVLRIVDLSVTGITDKESLAHIKYTLAGANSDMGGATVKIAICTPGTTFYMASVAGSISYANGAGTYNYVPGDPVPTVSANLKKVFTFARTAGDLDETWNGFDEGGAALPNDNYVFAISATDDSGNHAIDNSGNDRIIIGNITIDRTSAQAGGDSTPPTVTTVSAGSTNLSATSGIILSQPFSTVVVRLDDAGGSGVDLQNTMITLTGPTTSTIALTPAYDAATNTVTLTFAQQTTNGTYTIRVRPKDKVGNTASDAIYTFTLSVTSGGAAAAFDETMFVYPNPARGVPLVTFRFDITVQSQMKLEVFNILGEQVYDESWTATPGIWKTWDLKNKDGSKLGSGVYLYRITADSVTAKPKLKKLIIIQ